MGLRRKKGKKSEAKEKENDKEGRKKERNGEGKIQIPKENRDSSNYQKKKIKKKCFLSSSACFK
jgi:hypothetical protein